MKNEKIGNKEFVRQISKRSGYAQKDIAEVLNTAAEILHENIDDGVETTVFKGMVIYPSYFNNKYKFPRARFGTFFKDFKI